MVCGVGFVIVFCFEWYVGCLFCLYFSKIEKIKKCAMRLHRQIESME
ncbi:hypothetical protein N646_2058 [Vibrio alginolyticus NBRC 15630 = ATCC 17749]|uniref:Uncharacterized protein n=1 Tax=Vibrio alginolyticus (strain ATCC 17749 / DSM 2171 / NBRC 15630 / NCIMB 1903 / NCTC 12160 / XII-53) TaxID=1219076 RepID=A0A2I3CC72_VIBAX|nr:hypothetical protein N646_2058 [Vibrio alginolyticus NBRC 15630 = ATCC 17749]